MGSSLSNATLALSFLKRLYQKELSCSEFPRLDVLSFKKLREKIKSTFFSIFAATNISSRRANSSLSYKVPLVLKFTTMQLSDALSLNICIRIPYTWNTSKIPYLASKNFFSDSWSNFFLLFRTMAVFQNIWYTKYPWKPGWFSFHKYFHLWASFAAFNFRIQREHKENLDISLFPSFPFLGRVKSLFSVEISPQRKNTTDKKKDWCQLPTD